MLYKNKEKDGKIKWMDEKMIKDEEDGEKVKIIGNINKGKVKC